MVHGGDFYTHVFLRGRYDLVTNLADRRRITPEHVCNYLNIGPFSRRSNHIIVRQKTCIDSPLILEVKISA